MEQGTDRPGAEGSAPRCCTTGAGIGETPPGEGLRAYLVPGLATPHRDWRTEGKPAELAAMFADLAARLALIDPASLPDGSGLSVVVSFQPDAPSENNTDEVGVSIINAAAAMLMPGVGASRSPLGKGMQYGAGAQTAAGLRINVFTGVTPTDVERAMLDAVEVARVEPRAERGAAVRFLREAADAGHAPTMLYADEGDESPRLFTITCTCNDYVQPEPLHSKPAREAWRVHAAKWLTEAADLRTDFAAAKLGHVISIEPAGKMDAPDLVAAVCSCGDYRSSPGTEAMGRVSWRQHAAVRLAQATGGASS